MYFYRVTPRFKGCKGKNTKLKVLLKYDYDGPIKIYGQQRKNDIAMVFQLLIKHWFNLFISFQVN